MVRWWASFFVLARINHRQHFGVFQSAVVAYQCSEDGVSDTIKPRLEKCGADCRNVAFINEETYSGLTLDDERIRQAIIEFRPRLVVIDPIQAYLGSDSDLQIAGRARKLMQRLGMWASVYDCAIVLIGHWKHWDGRHTIVFCTIGNQNRWQSRTARLKMQVLIKRRS